MVATTKTTSPAATCVHVRAFLWAFFPFQGDVKNQQQASFLIDEIFLLLGFCGKRCEPGVVVLQSFLQCCMMNELFLN